MILEVTPELLESATVISEQLVMATDSEDAVGLLPLDLNTTNNVVAQVRDTGTWSFIRTNVNGGFDPLNQLSCALVATPFEVHAMQLCI